MSLWKFNLSKAATLALLVAICLGFSQFAMANSGQQQEVSL
jgi:hypothetical protein